MDEINDDLDFHDIKSFQEMGKKESEDLQEQNQFYLVKKRYLEETIGLDNTKKIRLEMPRVEKENASLPFYRAFLDLGEKRSQEIRVRLDITIDVTMKSLTYSRYPTTFVTGTLLNICLLFSCVTGYGYDDAESILMEFNDINESFNEKEVKDG